MAFQSARRHLLRVLSTQNANAAGSSRLSTVMGEISVSESACAVNARFVHSSSSSRNSAAEPELAASSQGTHRPRLYA